MNDASVTHRLRAILAADAVGFSRLMAADDDATVHALDAARSVFRQHTEARRGRVIDMAGDSVLAVFESATGAVAAALAIQQALNAAAGELPPERRMRFRVGVHLGDVVEKDDGTVYGDGVNVAARLQALAEPGGITASEAVRGVVIGRVAARFVDRGEQALKNIGSPIRTFAVETASGAEPAATAPAAPDVPAPAPRAAHRPAGLFVGRRQEMEQLAKAMASARAGRGRLVLLAGPGGMGKTRLAQEMAARAEEDGVPVLWGRCLEEPGAPPYWPWRQLIRSYLRAGEDPDPATTLGAGLADIASIVPELRERFTVPTPGDGNAVDAAQSRFRLFDAVAGFWRRASQRQAQLLIFEDLHWADATSLRLFAFLAAELEDSALLVIGTYRDTEVSRQHPLFDTLAELGRSPAFSRIELGGLNQSETQEFISAAGAGAAGTPLSDAICARTEGHPLFLEETLRFMMDTRSVAVDGDARLVQGIPAGVREVIGKRLNRLSERAGALLTTASCIGRSFELGLLAQLEATSTEDALLAALEEALAVKLIEQVPQGQDRFRFSHALVRECIYDEMLGLRRARLHLRIGELLEQRLAAEDDPSLLPQLAYHFSEAGPGAAAVKALDYARRSAERAQELLALEEAARQYRLALHLQQQNFAGDAVKRCELLLALGDVEVLLGAEPAHLTFQEAANLARREGQVRLFAHAALGFEASTTVGARPGAAAAALLLEAIDLHRALDPLRVQLFAQLCRAYVYCDLADEAKEAHRHAVHLARQIGDAHGLRAALAAIASAVYWPDLLRVRLAAAGEAWGITEGNPHLRFVAELLPFYLIDLMQAGDRAGLARLREEGLRLTERTGALHYQAISRCVEAMVATNEGRFDDAQRWANQALAVGRRVAEEQAMGVYGMQMFCLRREQGRLRETLPLLEHFVRTTPKALVWQPGLGLLYAELDMRAECEAQFEGLPWSRIAAPRDASTMTVMMFAAEVCVYLGDAQRAALLYGVLKAYAGSNLLADSGGPCLGSADRLLGSLSMVQRQWVVAQRHFEAALAMDQKTGSRVWLAHSRYAYAVMLQRRDLAGDAELARSLLAEALVDGTAIGMNALVPRIEALTQALGTPAPALPCGLTERELGVLRLIAMGRNNREIGQVLSISPNTVANHVRSILDKTYTANRTEAAAFARSEGLLKE